MKTLENMSFKTRLSVGFSILSIVSFSICGYVSYRSAGDLIKSITMSSLQDRISSLRTSVQVSFRENQDRQNTMMDLWGRRAIKSIRFGEMHSGKTQVVDQVSQQRYDLSLPSVKIDEISVLNHNYVDELSTLTGDAVTIFARVPEGLVRISTSVKTREGKRAVNSMIPSTSPVFKSVIGNKRYSGRAMVVGAWYNTVYEPIFQDGQVVGAFFMGSPETTSVSIAELLKGQKIQETGYYFIMESSGKLVLHPESQGKSGLEIADADGQFPYKTMTEVKDGSFGFRQVETDRTASDHIAVFQYFPEVDWIIGANIRTDEALSALGTLQWALFTISSVLTILMAFAAIAFGHLVGRSLQKLATGLTDSYERVQESSQNLAENSEHVASATGQQAASLQLTVSAVNEIEATLKHNLNATEEAQAQTAEMSETVQHGRESLKNLTDSIHKIAANTVKLQSEMGSSYEQLDGISKIIENIEAKTRVINEIVFQTKLLSFNAAVEAARAGAHGKGFAVVAEEVGRLASMSGNAANEIRGNLESSRVEVGSIVSSARAKLDSIISESRPLAQVGVKLSESCNSDFTAIQDQVDLVNKSVAVIHSSSKEQASGVREISLAVQEMDSSTQVNSAAAAKVQQLAGQLNDESIELQRSIRGLKDMVRGRDSSEDEKTVKPLDDSIRRVA